MCVPSHTGWQNETQVKRPGEAIVLNCEADFPLHWCYPRVYEDDCVVRKHLFMILL
jgi:hypothetical protein